MSERDDEVEMMLEAFALTFSVDHEFWEGSPVRQAALAIIERRGGREAVVASWEKRAVAAKGGQ